MTKEECFFLFFLLFGFACQLFFRRRQRARKIFLALFAFLVFYFLLKASLLSYLTYQVWQDNPLSKYLLPPYQNISYFLGYAFFHFFRSLVFNFFFSFFLFLAMTILNKCFQERFFEKEEPALAAFASFFCSWPANLVFLFLVLFLGISIHLLYFLLGKKEKKFSRRISFYYLWIPLSFFVIIFHQFLVSLPNFDSLNL